MILTVHRRYYVEIECQLDATEVFIADQPISSVIESIRHIMTTFNFQQISTQMRHLARKLQETDDPVNKLFAVIDTVVNCLANFK